MRWIARVAVMCYGAQAAQAAAPHYFATTAAGFTPPSTAPIALQQNLGGGGAPVAYDSLGTLYYVVGDALYRWNANGTDTLVTQFSNNYTLGITVLAADSQQNLYFSDDNACLVQKVDRNGVVSRFAGNGQPANTAKAPAGPGIPGTAFAVCTYGLAVGPDGSVYVFDQVSASIIAFTPDGLSSKVIAGIGSYGAEKPLPVLATTTPLSLAGRLAVAGTKLYVDNGGFFRVIDLQTGIMSAVPGFASAPESFTVAGDGSLYVGNPGSVIKYNSSLSSQQPFAGTGAIGIAGDGGSAVSALVASPYSLAVNSLTGDVAIGDSDTIRVVNAASGKIQTVAGVLPFGGDGGPEILALFNHAGNLAIDSAGNTYVADAGNNRIRKITPAGIVSTLGGNGVLGNSGDNGKAIQAELNPAALTTDPLGNVYFVQGDPGSTPYAPLPGTIRKIDTSGIITTIAGGGVSGTLAAGLQATSVQMTPAILAADASGNVYFANQSDFQVWKIDATGKLSRAAGSGRRGDPMEGFGAIASPLGTVTALAVDSAGLLYVGESDTGRVVKVDSQGLFFDVAGTGVAPQFQASLTNGPATSVQLNSPSTIAVDAAGNVYFATYFLAGAQQLAMVDTTGNLTAIAGINPSTTSNGDGGDATQAVFLDAGLAVDAQGNLFLSDSGAYIRKFAPYNPANPPPFLSTGGVIGAGGSLPAVAAASPGGLETLFGANFVTPANEHSLQASDLVNGKVPTTMAGVCVSFGGTPGALTLVYPGQINVQVPALPPGPVTVQVTANCGKSNAVTSNLGAVVMQAASPEFFSFKPDPVAGNNPIAAINAVTFGDIGAPGLIPGATFTPASPGGVVEAYGTGWGLTNPAIGLGVVPGAAAPLAAPYSVTFGGVTLPASSILYAGASPCCVGLYQIDFTVPAGTPNGNQTLVISVGGVSSPPQAFIDVLR